MRSRLTFVYAALAFAVLVAASGVIFQDNISRFLVSPKSPFLTQSETPGPDYGTPEAWYVHRYRTTDGEPVDPDLEPAVFYVHSTSYFSGARWNAAYDDETAAEIARRALIPNELGPAATVGETFAPKYRQATLFAFFTHKFDGVAARQFAYDDIEAAFGVFLQTIGEERPILLLGYGQGGLHVLRLVEDHIIGNEALTKRLAAAYIIDQPTPLELFDDRLSGVGPCKSETAIRCIVSYVAYEPRFDEEVARTKRRSMYWRADGDLTATAQKDLLCINPLTWASNDERIEATEHVGAASATGIAYGSTPPSFPRAVGAQCVDGVLLVDPPAQRFLRQNAWFGRKWREKDFNLFYFDLQRNFAQRLSELARVRYEEAQFLDPIDNSVDLGTSPINPVPE